MQQHQSSEQRRAALHYIHTIRNSAKQAYANHYHMYLLNGTPMPPVSAFRLGGMARQAVEMNLRDILNPDQSNARALGLL